MNFDKLKKECLNCTKCELSKTRTNVVFGEGPKKVDLLFLGEAPGKNEDLTGKPFCGASGKLLTELMTKAGIDREKTFVTSILKCRPPNNRKPKKIEIQACKYWLYNQIKILEPKLIFLLGNTAIEALFDTKNASLLRGQIVEKDNIKYFCSYHPAACIYNRKLTETLIGHLKQAKKIAQKI